MKLGSGGSMDPSRVVAALAVAALGSGCAHHYRSTLPLDPDRQVSVASSVAAVGIIERALDGNSSLLTKPTERLADEVGTDGERPVTLSVADVELLLSGPAWLSLHSDRLAALRQRVGRRYVVVGEESSAPVLESHFWNSLIVVPFPGGVVWFTIPLEVSSTADVPHEAHVLRVVDLDEARIVSEWCEIMTHHHDDDSLNRGSVDKALASMGL